MALEQSNNAKRQAQRKLILHCILILGALFMVIYFVKEKFFDQAITSFTSESIFVAVSDDESYLLEEDSGPLVQEFEVTTDVLWGLELEFARRQENPQGTIEMVVCDDMGVELFNENIPISTIPNNVKQRLIFQQVVPDTKGKVYTLKLHVRDIAAGDSLEVFANRRVEYPHGTFSDASGELKGNIRIEQVYGQNTYMRKVFYGFCLAAVLLSYGLYFSIFVKKCKFETVFLLFVIFIGLTYAAVMGPGSVPDEDYHYRTAYGYSNILLGKAAMSGYPVEMDVTDYEMYQVGRVHSMSAVQSDTYQHLLSDFGGRAARTETIVTKETMGGAVGYLYIGQVAGITIARLGGFNGLTGYYLGRIFNVLIFALMAFWSIKKLPIYKMSMFAICLFPMTVQLIGSLSYDSIILGIALVLFTQIMALLYGESKVASKKDLFVLAFASILLGGCKGGAYVPLLILLALIPVSYFKNKRHKVGFITGVSLGTILMFLVTAATTVSSSIGDTVVGWADKPPYTISWIIQNPLEFMQLIMNTIFENSDGIIGSIFGKELGWFNVPLQWLMIWGFIGIFLLSCIYVTDTSKTPPVKVKQKRAIFAVVILVVAVVAAAMMFSWTPIDSPVITGIQGRYLTPILLPLVFCLKNETLTLQRSLDDKLIFALGWFHILTIINIFARVFSPWI
jgi:Predicted membrane protein